MIELGFSLIIIALLGLLAWEKYQNRQERSKFINALMSKNAEEMANLDLSDKTKIKAETKPRVNPREYIPLDDLDDEAFIEAIKKSEGVEDAE